MKLVFKSVIIWMNMWFFYCLLVCDFFYGYDCNLLVELMLIKNWSVLIFCNLVSKIGMLNCYELFDEYVCSWELSVVRIREELESEWLNCYFCVFLIILSVCCRLRVVCWKLGFKCMVVWKCVMFFCGWFWIIYSMFKLLWILGRLGLILRVVWYDLVVFFIFCWLFNWFFFLRWVVINCFWKRLFFGFNLKVVV